MLNPGMPEDQFFHLLIPHTPLTPAVRSCPGCGLSFEIFRQHSVVGCRHCYEHFRETVTAVARNLHGSAAHHGKIPLNAADKLRKRIARLQQQQRQAVEEERFEDAAAARDEIRRLRRELHDPTD